jgi:hypothetical protein
VPLAEVASVVATLAASRATPLRLPEPFHNCIGAVQMGEQGTSPLGSRAGGASVFGVQPI